MIKLNKCLKITKEAYDELVRFKKQETEDAKSRGNMDRWQELVSMGIGAYCGFIIFRFSRIMESDQHGEDN